MRLLLSSSGGSPQKSLNVSRQRILLTLALVALFVLSGTGRSHAELAGSSTRSLTPNALRSPEADLGEYVRNHTTTVSSRPGIHFAKGVIIVELSEDVQMYLDAKGTLRASSSALDGVLRARGLLRAERLFPWDCESRRGGECGFWRLTFPEQADLDSLMNDIKRAPGVTGIQPVGVHAVNFYPNDVYFPLQWGLNQTQHHDVNAVDAWDLERGDSSIVVAIVDTGVDWSHPDLGGVAPYTGGNIWTNWAEFYGTPGVDDDHNGFIDDIRGWDFVTGVSTYSGEDGSTPDNDPSDFFGHGTHVAGIVGAITDNTIGVAGLANKCKIMPVRAGWSDYGMSGAPVGKVSTDFCAQAIFYAARNGARVINCSWENDNSGGLGVAVDSAIARGAIVVVSAGNNLGSSQERNYLSTRGDCFVVAATDSSDIREPHSNYGAWVNFSAPGADIASTYYDGRVGYRVHTYAYATGTSMSAPFVCALSALLLSKAPWLSRSEVFNTISSTCDPIDALNPDFAGQLGAGRIDAYAALASLPIAPPTPGFAVTAFPNPFQGTVTFNITVGDSAAGSGERGKIELYDVAGRRVAQIPVIGDGSSVSVAWNGGNDNGHKIASGVYFYKAEVDGRKAGGKIVFFKE